MERDEPEDLDDLDPSPLIPSDPLARSSIREPLRVKGTKFIDPTGHQVKLMGAISCCEESKTTGGWPWASEYFMREVKAHGGNHITLRLGPNAGQEAVTTLYNNDGNKYSFDGYIPKSIPGWEPYYPLEFDPNFWARLRKTINLALSLDLYAEVSVVDGWCLRHRWPPWESNYSGIMASRPKTHHKVWIQKVAKECGRYPNVIYLCGNENFLPRDVCQPAWEIGMVDLIREQETKHGHPRHLIGTNSRNKQIEKNAKMDFVVEHGDQAVPPRWNKPLYINEAGPRLTAKTFAEQAKRALELGSAFLLWRGDMKEPEFQRALDEMAKIQEA